MTRKDYPRAIITAAVLVLFAFAYINDPDDEMMKGALIAAFSLAISYWLGSSKGSSDKSAVIEEMNNGPIDAQIVNNPSDPVPTEAIR